MFVIGRSEACGRKLFPAFESGLAAIGIPTPCLGFTTGRGTPGKSHDSRAQKQTCSQKNEPFH
tara:strand:+ start:2266 stop:2454 length:189 start_codon:yes stop_codon:yes gene_type:complete